MLHLRARYEISKVSGERGDTVRGFVIPQQRIGDKGNAKALGHDGRDHLVEWLLHERVAVDFQEAVFSVLLK